MIGSAPPYFPLPSGWPKRIRSAILHAVCLAHASLTVTRSHAANSWSARIRLKAENDRLRQEIGLLREELRIKDNRMDRIPAVGLLDVVAPFRLAAAVALLLVGRRRR